MREQVLRDYFLSKTTAEDLARDLAGAVIESGARTFSQRIKDMDQDYEVTAADLVRLCDDVLVGRIPPRDLESIGFCLVASDRFHWDGDTVDGGRVAETLYDWASPEINWPLNKTTVAKFRHRLATGEDTFTGEDVDSRSA